MGNYCCSDTQTVSKFKTKHRIMQSNLQTQKKCPQQETRNSQNQLPFDSNIPTKIVAQKLQYLCKGPPITKGGQSQIFQVRASLHDEPFGQSPAQLTTLIIKKITKTQSINESLPSPCRNLLMNNESPFLMKGLKWFNGDKFIFQVMQKQEGGDLSTFLQSTKGKGDQFRRLGDQGIKMILAGIILGMQYIHSQHIIYCDLKLENVLIGTDGYPLIIDFDMARKSQRLRSDEVKGTMVYIAPEVLNCEYVDKSIDIWALGILTYMLVYGEPPFEQQQIMEPDFINECRKKQGKFFLRRKKASKQMIQFINSLLKVDPKSRLGYKSVSQLKSHKLFQNFNWYEYQKKQIKNPLRNIVDRFSPKKQVFSFKQFTDNVDPLFLTPPKFETRSTKCNMSTKSSL